MNEKKESLVVRVARKVAVSRVVEKRTAVKKPAAVVDLKAVAQVATNANSQDNLGVVLPPLVAISESFYDEENKVMNAFALLKADHKKVATMLETLNDTTERANKGRQQLFARLKEELDLHARIEEEIFYPALEEAEETRDITLEAFEEHRLVKQLLAELEAEPKDTEEWTAKFTVLKENVEHHVEEEEGEMFKKARQVLSEEEIVLLGERLQKAKQEGKAAIAR